MIDGYIYLCAAIIKRAVDDYREALQAVQYNPHAPEVVKKLERFFLSRWGQTLSFGHGELIIERTRKEVLQNGSYTDK